MKTIHIKITLALLAVVMAMQACKQENDFHFVGRQPVNLLYPRTDTAIVLNYAKADSLHLFLWNSKRNFIDYNLVLGLDEDFSGKKEKLFTGIRSEFYLPAIKIDSLMGVMEVGIGQSARVYWTVEVVDPSAAWCDEVRFIDFTRCALPDNVIVLTGPADETELQLDKENTEEVLEFGWECSAPVDDYVLLISPDEAFTDPLKVECEAGKSHSFTHGEFDEWLGQLDVERGEEAQLWWKVTGSGDLVSPVENSVVNTLTVKRFVRDAVPVVLVSPAVDETVVLEAAKASENFSFRWECDTVGVSFKVRLFDPEWETEQIFEAGENSSYDITQEDLDMLLGDEFGMVASQRKKLIWEVIPSDDMKAVPGSTGEFIIRRFEAAVAAQPILLTAGPSDGAQFTLDYVQADRELATVAWDCDAVSVTYALEYALDSNMDQPKRKVLGRDKAVSFTHRLLDEMLSDLGGAYLTRTIYWRIVSTVAVLTEPSETRSMSVTGMLRPLVDNRDPQSPETYNVVYVAGNFWMAENLRARMYSDGTPFTAVDLPSKTPSVGIINDAKVSGQYYTWPTALRDWQQADESTDRIIQGVCPDGWHVSTRKEWNDLAAAVSWQASKVNSAEYWAYNAGDGTTGLNLMPGGMFWHGQVPDSDLMFGSPGADANDQGGLRASYWLTTVASEFTAYSYDSYDWLNTLEPGQYACRPFSEGADKASRMMNVRCVRDKD